MARTSSKITNLIAKCISGVEVVLLSCIKHVKINESRKRSGVAQRVRSP